MNDMFWLTNPKILLKREKILDIWPNVTMNYAEKMNATTRFIILITVIGQILLNRYIISLLGIILILIIVFIYNHYKAEEFTNMKKGGDVDAGKYTRFNPLYNVMPSDYVDNVDKEKIKHDYTEETRDIINHQVKQFVYENNKGNDDIGKIFDNVSDKLDFESSMRQFNINPITTIPNGQDEFLKFCYSTLPSEKPLLIY